MLQWGDGWLEAGNGTFLCIGGIPCFLVLVIQPASYLQTICKYIFSMFITAFVLIALCTRFLCLIHSLSTIRSEFPHAISAFIISLANLSSCCFLIWCIVYALLRDIPRLVLEKWPLLAGTSMRGKFRLTYLSVKSTILQRVLFGNRASRASLHCFGRTVQAASIIENSASQEYCL